MSDAYIKVAKIRSAVAFLQERFDTSRPVAGRTRSMEQLPRAMEGLYKPISAWELHGVATTKLSFQGAYSVYHQ